MKKYIPGFIISALVFMVIAIVNSQIYDNLMPDSAITMLLTLHVFFFPNLKENRRYKTYAGFVLLVAVVVYICLPNYTQQQALERATAEFEMEVKEMANVPVIGGHEWNPLEPDRAYLFRGNQGGQAISVMVGANDGNVFRIEE